MKIYVVMGTTGEWSDRIEWPVYAYPTKALAEAHVILASNYARELYAKHKGNVPMQEMKSPYDPKISIDYNGTSYFVYEVELLCKETPHD